MSIFLDYQSKYRAHAIAIGLLLVIAITAGISWPALHGPFLFDDFPNLQHLSSLNGELEWRSLAHYVSLFDGQPGRPLSMLSFVINDASWPSDPWSFKYTNLLLHLLVGTLLFGFSRGLARFSVEGPGADLIALLAAAAWLLHPMQLSTSMLIVQRMTQLSALFAVAGLWGYVAIASRAKGPLAALGAISVLGVGTVLSLLCKENGALTPLLALVVNVTLFRRCLEQVPTPARLVLIGGTVLPIVVLLIAILIRWDALTWYGTRDFTMAERLLSQPRVLSDYLFHVAIPNLRGGGIYHDDFEVSRTLLSPWTTLPSLLAVVGAIGAGLALRRQWPLFAFSVLWFFAGHLLESTVFPLELYFEHRNYLPMFGVLFALAMAAGTARSRRTLFLSLAAAWITYAAFLTSVQSRVWGSESALASVWAAEHPGSARAVQQQAGFLASSGNSADAADLLIQAYRRGIRGGSFPLQALALACTKQGAFTERLDLPLRNIGSDPYGPAVLATVSSLRTAAENRTCPGLLDEDAWLRITDRLLANPHYAAGEAQAYLRVERSYLFRARRNLGATMRELEAAWAVNPDPALARLIAATLASGGLYDDAEAWVERSAASQPAGLRGLLSGDRQAALELRRAIQELRHQSR